MFPPCSLRYRQFGEGVWHSVVPRDDSWTGWRPTSAELLHVPGRPAAFPRTPAPVFTVLTQTQSQPLPLFPQSDVNHWLLHGVCDSSGLTANSGQTQKRPQSKSHKRRQLSLKAVSSFRIPFPPPCPQAISLLPLPLLSPLPEPSLLPHPLSHRTAQPSGFLPNLPRSRHVPAPGSCPRAFSQQNSPHVSEEFRWGLIIELRSPHLLLPCQLKPRCTELRKHSESTRPPDQLSVGAGCTEMKARGLDLPRGHRPRGEARHSTQLHVT